jgi:hypothetical protein
MDVMNRLIIRQRLLDATTVATIDEMTRQLRGADPVELFYALFPAAINNRLTKEAGQFSSEPWEHLCFRAGKLL